MLVSPALPLPLHPHLAHNITIFPLVLRSSFRKFAALQILVYNASFVFVSTGVSTIRAGV